MQAGGIDIQRMLHGTRRFVPCADRMRALIASSFSCVQPEGGQFPSDVPHVSKRQTWLDQEKATEKKLTLGIRVSACIAIAIGSRGIRNQSFAVATANTCQAAAGSC
jgi:hypothetical protein